MRLDFVRFDIPMQLQCIVERFEPTIEKRGLRLTLRPGEGSFQAAADREALTKIVSNLLNNALKYAEHEIEVALEHEQRDLLGPRDERRREDTHTPERKDFRTLFRIDRTGRLPEPASDCRGPLLGPAAQGASVPRHGGSGQFVRADPPARTRAIHQSSGTGGNARGTPRRETEMLLADPQEPTETASSEQDYSVLLVEDNTAIQQYLAGRCAGNAWC